MAEKLDGFDFAANHGNALYPWAEWFGGDVVKLKQGEDFDVEPHVMRGQVIVRARREGRPYRTNVRGTEVVFAVGRDGETAEQFAERIGAHSV